MHLPPSPQVVDIRSGPSSAGDAAAGYEVLRKAAQYEVRSYAAPPVGARPAGGGAPAAVGTGGGPTVYAVAEFGGAAGPAQAEAAAQALRRALAADGLQPAPGTPHLVAAAGEGPALLRKNEVLVQLQAFQLW